MLAEAEKKRLAQEKERLAQEKERLAILKRNQQQLDRKINRLAGIVIDVALSDKNYQFSHQSSFYDLSNRQSYFQQRI